MHQWKSVPVHNNGSPHFRLILFCVLFISCYCFLIIAFSISFRQLFNWPTVKSCREHKEAYEMAEPEWVMVLKGHVHCTVHLAVDGNIFSLVRLPSDIRPCLALCNFNGQFLAVELAAAALSGDVYLPWRALFQNVWLKEAQDDRRKTGQIETLERWMPNAARRSFTCIYKAAPKWCILNRLICYCLVFN